MISISQKPSKEAIIRRPEPHNIITRIRLPNTIDKHHDNVEIALDFFFVNGRSFLHTKSGKTDFRSVQACNSRGNYEIISGLKEVKTNLPR